MEFNIDPVRILAPDLPTGIATLRFPGNLDASRNKPVPDRIDVPDLQAEVRDAPALRLGNRVPFEYLEIMALVDFEIEPDQLGLFEKVELSSQFESAAIELQCPVQVPGKNADMCDGFDHGKMTTRIIRRVEAAFRGK